MNRIYRVVWCHIRQTHVVASELASRKKSNGKSSSLLKPIVVGMIFAFSSAGISLAATGDKGGIGSGTAISPSNSECGGDRWSNKEANAQQKGNIAIGCEARAEDSVNTFMYDRGNPKNNIDSKSTFSSISIGAKSRADKASVSIGSGAESTELGVAFGSQARSRGVAAIALGAAALSTGNTSLALGRQSAATADFAQAIGNVAIAEGKGSLAMGHSATASGNRSIAIGSADIDNAGSTGSQQGTMYQKEQQTLSTGKDSIAIGAAAKAQGDYTLAVGAHARAEGENSTAMGFDSFASGKDSFAAGRSALAEGQDAFALGANAHGQGVKSFAMGTQSQAIGENALALGSLSVAREQNSIAVGVGAQANFADSVALGSGAIVSHDNSISIGTGSTTNNYDATAFLFEENVAGAVATGAVSIGNGAGSISENSASNERRLQNLAAGSLDTDAVNVSQLRKLKIISDQSAEDVADHLGGDSKYDPKTGIITAPIYNITNKEGNNVQVNDVGTAIETIDGTVVNNTNNITNITSGKSGLVQLSDEGEIVIDNTLADNATFNLANADGSARQLTGVKNGELSATSTDAVNGSQLHATNTNVENIDGRVTVNEGNISTIQGDITNITNKTGNSLTGIEDAFGAGAEFDKDGNLMKPNYKDALSADQDLESVEDGFKYVGGKLIEHGDQITNIEGDITNITSGKSGLVQLSDEGEIVIDNTLADNATFNLANADGSARQLTGVKEGELSTTSTDAVNGSQLHATNTNVENLDGRVTVNEGNISTIQGDITNITTNTGNTLKGIEDALGGGAKFNGDGELAMPNYKDALTADKDLKSVEEGFEYVNGKLTGITTGAAGLIKLSDDGKSLVVDNTLAKDATSFNFSNEGVDRTLTGVEKGKLDNDAVNVSQLKKVTDGLGGGSTIDPDTGEVTGPTYNITNKEGDNVVHNNVGDALTEIDQSVTNITNKTGQSLTGIEEALGAGAKFNGDGELAMPNYKEALSADKDLESVEDGFKYVGGKLIEHGDQITNIEGDITNITSGKSGLVQLSDEGEIVIDNTLADNATFNLANADGSTRQLTGVKDGELSTTSTDAVNGSQLYTTNTNVENLDGRVTVNEGNISTIQGDITNITNKAGQSLTGIEEALGAGAKFDENGKLAMPNYKDALSADKDLKSVEDGFEYVNGKLTGITTGTAGLIKLSDDGKSLVVDNTLAKDATSFNFSNEGVDRTLTGVEKGKLANDAVNVSQLKSVTDGLGGGSTINPDTGEVTGPTYNITNKEGDKVVHNNVGDALDVLDGSVTNNTTNITNLENKSGTSLTGIADAFGGDAKFDDKGQLTGVNYQGALGSTDELNSVYEGFEYVGGKLIEHGDQIVNIDNRVTKTEGDIVDITSGKAGLVQLSDDNKTVVIDNNLAKDAMTFDISNNGVGRKLDGVAAGRISKDSEEAINGGQLFNAGMYIVDSLGAGAVYNLAKGEFSGLNFKKALAAEEDIETVEQGFAYLKDNLQSFEDGEAGLLQLKDGKLVFSEKALGATFDITDGKEARTLTGVKAGAVTETSLDAINGSQLHTTNKSIVDSLGGGAELNDDGSIKGPTYVINNGDSYNNVGDAITNIDGRVINNMKNITNLTENMNNISTGKAGLVMIEGDRIVFDNSIAGDRIFDISNNGQTRKMTGVADGNVAAESKEAVNGGQLYDTNQKVATNTDNIGKNTEALGGGAGIDKDGNYTGPNYSFNDGSNHTNVGSALDNLDGRVTDLDQRVDGISNGTEGLVKLETDDQGNQKLVIDNNLASKADTFDISNGEEGRTLTGLNDGKVSADSKDAINGSQLHTSNSTIADIFGGGASVDKDGYVSMPEYDFGDENKFNNVGDSLTHLNNKIQKGEGGLFQMSADGKTVVLGDTAKTATSVDMGNRVVAGVANGRVEKDSLEAINGGQLWETNQQVGSNTTQIKHINNTLNHYNTRISNLEKTVHENRKRASAGTASAMAMSSIPYLDYAKYSFGMGVASYDGEAAMSMGLEFKMGDNGRFRIQGSYDTQNKAGVGVGMAFEL